MKKINKKLVLFDIDGTLVDSGMKSVGHWKERITAVFERVYKTPIPFALDVHNYNGKVDKQVFWIIAEQLSISREIFDSRYEDAKVVYHDELERVLSIDEDVYRPLKDAQQFARSLGNIAHVSMGVITGNIEVNAWAKLRKAGMQGLFTFGAFSDDMENRAELVQHAIKKSKLHFKTDFLLEDIFVIGDTVHDIQAAKTGGVRSIGVSTGVSANYETLSGEGADLVVSSLLDERVYTLLGLNK